MIFLRFFFGGLRESSNFAGNHITSIDKIGVGWSKPSPDEPEPSMLVFYYIELLKAPYSNFHIGRPCVFVILKRIVPVEVNASCYFFFTWARRSFCLPRVLHL